MGEYRRVLGFAPELRLKGPVDTAVTELMREPLLKVVREALSNVSRHARATHVEVVARLSVPPRWAVSSSWAQAPWAAPACGGECR